MRTTCERLETVKDQVETADWLWLRFALYGGLLSSVGVTLGWFLWVALEVLLQSGHGHEVWNAALAGAAVGLRVPPSACGCRRRPAGAAVGLRVEWLRDYRAVARREAAGTEGEEGGEESEHDATPPLCGGTTDLGACSESVGCGV